MNSIHDYPSSTFQFDLKYLSCFYITKVSNYKEDKCTQLFMYKYIRNKMYIYLCILEITVLLKFK